MFPTEVTLRKNAGGIEQIDTEIDIVMNIGDHNMIEMSMFKLYMLFSHPTHHPPPLFLVNPREKVPTYAADDISTFTCHRTWQSNNRMNSEVTTIASRKSNVSKRKKHLLLSYIISISLYNSEI